jgi:transcriptional/translational regulatory protein YebC/TACO1
MFNRRGYFVVLSSVMDEEKFMELALELGADDMATAEDHYEIFTAVEDWNRVREELEKRGVPMAVKELAMVPTTTVDVPSERAGAILRLLETLEDHDDAQKVWANFNLPENAENDEKVLA